MRRTRAHRKSTAHRKPAAASTAPCCTPPSPAPANASPAPPPPKPSPPPAAATKPAAAPCANCWRGRRPSEKQNPLSAAPKPRFQTAPTRSVPNPPQLQVGFLNPTCPRRIVPPHGMSDTSIRPTAFTAYQVGCVVPRRRTWFLFYKRLSASATQKAV